MEQLAIWSVFLFLFSYGLDLRGNYDIDTLVRNSVLISTVTMINPAVAFSLCKGIKLEVANSHLRDLTALLVELVETVFSVITSLLLAFCLAVHESLAISNFELYIFAILDMELPTKSKILKRINRLFLYVVQVRCVLCRSMKFAFSTEMTYRFIHGDTLCDLYFYLVAPTVQFRGLTDDDSSGDVRPFSENTLMMIPYHHLSSSHREPFPHDVKICTTFC